jgi:carbon monoxide dehydrogenase subunit G
MPDVEASITIKRPADEVFDFVTTPENDPLWSSTAVERRRETEGPIAVGSRIKAVDKFLGRRIESTFEVTEHEPGRRSSIRLSGPVSATGSYILEPMNGATRFRWVMEADPGLGGVFLGRVTDPLVTFFFRRRLRFDLRRLKEVLEESRQTRPSSV